MIPRIDKDLAILFTKKRIIEKMLQKNAPIDFIMECTETTKEEVELVQEYMNKSETTEN